MDIEQYETYLGRLVGRGKLSTDTERKYLGTMRRFAAYHGTETEPEIADFQDYLLARAADDDLTGGSLNVTKCAFRKYLVMQGRSDEYPGLKDWFNENFQVSTGVNEDRLAPEELEAFRAAAESDPREHAIVELFVATGMRVGEMVRLDKDDIDFRPDPDRFGDGHAGTVSIHRQKRGEQVVDTRPLSGRTADAVNSYIESIPEYVGTDAAAADGLFVTDRLGTLSSAVMPSGIDADDTLDGEPATYRMTTARVNSLLSNVAERTDNPDVTPERMHAHLLRHTVGSRLGEEGYTAEKIGEFLGRVTPPQEYIHPGSEAIGEMASEL